MTIDADGGNDSIDLVSLDSQFAGQLIVDAGDGTDVITEATFGVGATLVGGAGDDVIFAGSGDDSIVGGDGDDSINGGLGNDVIDGGADDDTITGSTGVDSIDGGDGTDLIVESSSLDP